MAGSRGSSPSVTGPVREVDGKQTFWFAWFPTMDAGLKFLDVTWSALHAAGPKQLECFLALALAPLGYRLTTFS
ncbi:hypothetical protein VTI28DRAFT_4763 [Corynascus sepedonium]